MLRRVWEWIELRYWHWKYRSTFGMPYQDTQVDAEILRTLDPDYEDDDDDEPEAA